MGQTLSKNLPRGIREWRRIRDFPDYEVSNDGLVRSWRGRCDVGGSRASPVLMKGYVNDLGYRSVMLRKTGSPKPHHRLVHRLVAEGFIPNPNNLPDVAHREGVLAGDHVANLRWSTHRDNQMDMRRHGTMQDGEKCITAKLSAEQVEHVRVSIELFGRGCQRRLARHFNISTAQISRIKNGRRWASTQGTYHA